MEYSEMSKYWGRKGFYIVNGMKFKIIIKDVRNSYGRVQFLVVPECGLGKRWILEDSVSFEGELSDKE